MVQNALLASLSQRMLDVAKAIRATNPDRRQLSMNYWIPPHEYPGPTARIAELADEVTRLNVTMLDNFEVKQSLVFAILGAVVADEVDEGAFREEAAETLRGLITYSATQELHIQLANLILKSPFTFGPVQIHPIPNTGDTTEYDLKYKGPMGHGGPADFVNSYAVIKEAPGKGVKAWQNAIDTVQDALTILRAIGLPHLWARRWLEAGVAGRGFASGWVVLRRRARRPWDMSLGSGGPKELMRLEHMLSNWTETEIKNVEGIYTSKRPTNMQRKVLQALFWMGEATYPASSASKYVRLAVAFESAVGGESSRLTEIGTTEMLAERTAFLLGHDETARSSWHYAVKKLYGIRSRIMHGELESVGDDDLKHWAFLVWKTVRAVLNRTSEFGTVEQFAKWVRKQRYT